MVSSEVEDGNEVIEEFFNKIDSDKDGKLSWAEVNVALGEYESRSSFKLVDLLKIMEEELRSNTVTGSADCNTDGLSKSIDLTRFKEFVMKVPRIHGQRFQWVQSLNLNMLLARRLKLGNLFDELSGIREMTETDVDNALGSFFKDVDSAVKSEWIRLKQSGSSSFGFEIVEAAMRHGKYTFGAFGDTQMFQEGLENQIGRPDPLILKGIFRDNVLSEQSREVSVTSNYKIVYSPNQEFARVFGNPVEYKTDSSTKLKEEEIRNLGSVPIFLMEVAKGRHPEIKGPNEAELKDLDTEFQTLRKLNEEIRASNQGVFPGDIGNVQQSIELEFEGSDKESANKCHAELIEFAAHHKEMSFGVDPGQPPTGSKFCISIFGRLALFTPGENQRLIELFKSIHSSVQIKELPGSARTYIYCNFKDGKPTNLQEILSSLDFPKLSQISSLGESASKDEHIKSIVEQAQANNRIVCMQGRRHLSLRQLMNLKEIREAGLRVEEAVLVYQYTGPLFQVRFIRLVSAFFS
jgi:hypothetical protein